MNINETTTTVAGIRTILQEALQPVRAGLLMATGAMILGVLWAGYMAINHEQLHGGFEKQEAVLKAGGTPPRIDENNTSMGIKLIPRAYAHGDHEDHGTGLPDALHQHSHSGSLAMDAMRRLLRGHIHWMGLGLLSAMMLLVLAFTSLRPGWKTLLGWALGIGALAYPSAWILMGFRTVVMGPDAAKASVMWLFVPPAVLLLGSLVVVFGILMLEMTGWHRKTFFPRFFEKPVPVAEERE